MKLSLMKLVVVITCHIAIPIGLAIAGFYALAIITGHLIWAIAGAILSMTVAWFAARRYTLIAIGPLFQDRDFTVTWFFIAKYVLKLFLLLLITPAIVLVNLPCRKALYPFFGDHCGLCRASGPSLRQLSPCIRRSNLAVAYPPRPCDSDPRPNPA